MEPQIKNAIIESTSLSFGGREILECFLNLDYGDSEQGFGGYVLYLPKSYSHHEIKSFAGHFLYRCMEIAGVADWDKMKGKAIRVRCEDSYIEAIGHIIKEDWFCPKEDFAKKN